MDKAIRLSRGEEHPAYESLKKGAWPYLSTVSAGATAITDCNRSNCVESASRRVDSRGQEIGAPDIVAEFVAAPFSGRLGLEPRANALKGGLFAS